MRAYAHASERTHMHITCNRIRDILTLCTKTQADCSSHVIVSFCFVTYVINVEDHMKLQNASTDGVMRVFDFTLYFFVLANSFVGDEFFVIPSLLTEGLKWCHVLWNHILKVFCRTYLEA